MALKVFAALTPALTSVKAQSTNTGGKRKSRKRRRRNRSRTN